MVHQLSPFACEPFCMSVRLQNSASTLNSVPNISTKSFLTMDDTLPKTAVQENGQDHKLTMIVKILGAIGQRLGLT